MGTRVSIHGRALQFDPISGLLYANQRVVGGAGAGLVSRGKYVYVDSNVDGASGASPDEAVGTLAEVFANDMVRANSGDVVVVMPNHAETVTGAGGITHDIAGVTVIGLGHGEQRPRFLMDGGTAVSYLVSAADAVVSNLIFAAGHADIVTCFNITGTDAWIDSCEFVENVATENFVTEIKATGADNTADGLKVTNCRAVSIDASAAEFIEVAGDLDRGVFEGNSVYKDAGTAGAFILCATGKDLTNVRIVENELLSGATSGALFANSNTTANSGIIAHNLIGHHDSDAAAPIDVTGCRVFQNYAVGVDDASALLLPAVDDNS